MKIRRFLAGAGALFLTLALITVPVQVHAEDDSGTTTIKTTIPSIHTVKLKISAHGSVTIDEKTYTDADKEVEIPRMEKQMYTIQPDTGYQIESVSYGETGREEVVKLEDGTFTAPEIDSDEYSLIVTFKDPSKVEPSGNGTSDNGTSGNNTSGNTTSGNTTPGNTTSSNNISKVLTGDTANIMVYVIALMLSFFAGAVILYIRRKKVEK